MADRSITYGLEVPYAQDILQSQLNYYTGLGKFMRSVIGTGGLNGFLCTPTAPPSLAVNIDAGEIYEMEETDETDYGQAPYALPANPALLLKQGIYNGNAPGDFPTPAPVTPGNSIKYLIQIAFEEEDGVPVNRAFFGGSSATVNTQRLDKAIVDLKAGTPAPSPVTPTPDAGFFGAWVITVANGQTTVTSGDIVQYPGAPFFGADYGGTLQDMLTKVSAAATYLTPAEANIDYVKTPVPGATNLFFTASTAITPVTAVSTALVLIPDSAPFPWFFGGFFFPTHPCVATITLFWRWASSGVEQVFCRALLNSSGVISEVDMYSPVGPDNFARPMSITMAFNGTTDYIEFTGQMTSPGTTNLVIPYFSAAVIANI